MAFNPIKYVSRTFLTILNDMNTNPDLADKPQWFKILIAGVGDVLSMINNAQANNSYLRTAYTRRAVMDLCALIDYELTPATTSVGSVLFYFPSTVQFPFTVSAANLAATTKGSIAIASRRFESRYAETFTAVSVVTNLSTDPIASSAITVSRDFTTGEKVRISSSGTLPTGVTDRDYYVIRVDSTHIKISTTIAGAFSAQNVAISGGSGNLTVKLFSGLATCMQQETKPQSTIGTSDGVTAWQEFTLPDIGILRDTLAISINDVTWERVTNFAQSSLTDMHYVHVYNSDGSSFIRFGNGEYGAIPGVFDIVANYAVGGGADSNISTLNSVSTYAGGDSNIEGCANVTAFTGGADEESIETAKNIAPGTVKSRDRFITREDGQSLALGYGGISQVKVFANTYGLLSCRVNTIAIGGGNPNALYKAALQTYLVSKTVLESMDVRVEDTTITTIAVTSAAKMKSGFLWTNVQPYFRLAWKLFLTETGQEIIDLYNGNGIDSAIARINTLYSEAFTSSSFNQIKTLIKNLELYGARTFGDTVQLSDALAYIQGSVTGIDYMTVAAPIFPISCAANEVTKYGALTLSEIS